MRAEVGAEGPSPSGWADPSVAARLRGRLRWVGAFPTPSPAVADAPSGERRSPSRLPGRRPGPVGNGSEVGPAMGSTGRSEASSIRGRGRPRGSSPADSAVTAGCPSSGRAPACDPPEPAAVEDGSEVSAGWPSNGPASSRGEPAAAPAGAGSDESSGTTSAGGSAGRRRSSSRCSGRDSTCRSEPLPGVRSGVAPATVSRRRPEGGRWGSAGGASEVHSARRSASPSRRPVAASRPSPPGELETSVSRTCPVRPTPPASGPV